MRLSRLSNRQFRKLIQSGEVRFGNDDSEETRKMVKKWIDVVCGKIDNLFSQCDVLKQLATSNELSGLRTDKKNPLRNSPEVEKVISEMIEIKKSIANLYKSVNALKKYI